MRKETFIFVLFRGKQFIIIGKSWQWVALWHGEHITNVNIYVIPEAKKGERIFTHFNPTLYDRTVFIPGASLLQLIISGNAFLDIHKHLSNAVGVCVCVCVCYTWIKLCTYADHQISRSEEDVGSRENVGYPVTLSCIIFSFSLSFPLSLKIYFSHIIYAIQFPLLILLPSPILSSSNPFLSLVRE